MFTQIMNHKTLQTSEIHYFTVVIWNHCIAWNFLSLFFLSLSLLPFFCISTFLNKIDSPKRKCIYETKEKYLQLWENKARRFNWLLKVTGNGEWSEYGVVFNSKNQIPSISWQSKRRVWRVRLDAMKMDSRETRELIWCVGR